MHSPVERSRADSTTVLGMPCFSGCSLRKVFRGRWFGNGIGAIGVGAVEVFEPGGPKKPRFSRGDDRAGAWLAALARIWAPRSRSVRCTVEAAISQVGWTAASSWWSARQDERGLTGAPGADQHHRLFAVWTFGRRHSFFLSRLDRLENFFARLPLVPLGLGQQRALLQEGTHAVEFSARGGMPRKRLRLTRLF